MYTITGTFKDGQIVLDEAPKWPDGCRVTITLDDDDIPDTPEQIAEWIRWYDSLEPLIMTPEEEAEWEAALQAQKEFEISTFEERAKRIEELFP